MKREALVLLVLMVVIVWGLPLGEEPKAQGGHAPGITMECDTVVALDYQGTGLDCNAVDLSAYPILNKCVQ